MKSLGSYAAVLATLALATVTSPTAYAGQSSVVTVQTPRGVKQSFILVAADAKPTASVILFAGGHGALGVRSATDMKWGKGNFLVRSRDLFAAAGLQVAVIDAPADKQDGMNAVFRMSPAHAADIGAVASYLRAQADVPVWVVGTSMGTFSAAQGAIASKGVSGLVLSSTITRAKPQWNIAQSHPDGVGSMPLKQVSAPTLILSHRKDGCDITPAGDSPKLKDRLTGAKRVEVVLLDGGSPPRSEPCEAMSQHGFLGIEKEAVGAIAKFIAAN